MSPISSEKIQIHNVLDREERKKLMYDDHKLSRSEKYFVVGQLLRCFEAWVKRPVKDLEDMRESMTDHMSRSGIRFAYHQHRAYSILEENWDLLLDHAQKSSKDILNLIERKQGEVQSLRDGVSSCSP